MHAREAKNREAKGKRQTTKREGDLEDKEGRETESERKRIERAEDESFIKIESNRHWTLYEQLFQSALNY
jgi:hypothetical protein